MVYAREAFRYRDAELDLDYNTRRKLDLLMRTIGRPAPPDPARNAEMQAASGRMAEHFARARARTAGGAELTVDEIGAALRSIERRVVDQF